MLRLVLPDSCFNKSYVAALREGYRIGTRTIPSESEIKEIEKDPFTHLMNQNLQGGTFTSEDDIERKRVPDNHFWLVDGDEFIGGINIRYELNDFLEVHAGHMGYGVRPSQQRKGYASKMIGMALSIIKSRDVNSVMITANEENIGSWKAIEANGGVMTGTIECPFEVGDALTRQYWIDLKGMCG